MPIRSSSLPESVTYRISKRAVEIARQTGPRRTGKGVRALRPMRSTGEVGIVVPPRAHYMLYQEYGIRSFVMHSLAGKTIPIRLPDGTIIYRRATAENIGRRRITSRDERGRLITTKLSWWHPGLAPKLFMHKAIMQAIDEWRRDTPPEDVRAILASNPDFQRFLMDLSS